MIKLQVKIFLALAFLFLIIVILGVSGSLFIRKLAGESGNIIKDNQMSARYSVEMLQLLDKIHPEEAGKEESKDKLFTEFEKLLKAETSNVTEKGEAELVSKLSSAYSEFRKYYSTSVRKSDFQTQTSESYLNQKYSEMRSALYKIFRLNTEAILRRNEHALQTAGRVSNYMLYAGLASSLIALILIIYLPRYLVRPIHEIAGRMKKITDIEYNKKLNTGRKDELENLASAFNVMAQRDSAKTNLIATVS
ncbi:MAG: HAMP domain-containing protein, partial [Syntrophothermus sp.]